MRINVPTVLTVASLSAGCVASMTAGDRGEAARAAQPATTDEASYAIGVDIARTALEAATADGIALDADELARGVADVLNDRPLAMTEGRIRRTLEDLQQQVAEREAERRFREDPLFRLQAEDNAQAGEAFQRRFAARPGVARLDTGALYERLEAGAGRPAGDAESVTLSFTGATPDGQRFAQNAVVELEIDGMLPAVADAVRRMNTGERGILVLPAEAAYGVAGHTTPAGFEIGPNVTLIATVELLEVRP